MDSNKSTDGTKKTAGVILCPASLVVTIILSAAVGLWSVGDQNHLLEHIAVATIMIPLVLLTLAGRG